MNYLRDLIHRLRAGESERRIARDLGVSRPTVSRYHRMAEEHGYLVRGTALPEEAELLRALGPAPQPPRVPSRVTPYAETVTALFEQGLEGTAIYQRLRENYGFQGSYSAVRRYVRQLHPEAPRAVVRVHTAPGEEAQVDFGAVGELFDPVTSILRQAYVFVATLCYSRHQYAEFVFDQKVPTWIALHRRAFTSWGGVPQRLVPDNLKAAVAQVLIHDPVLGEAYRRMAQHYGFVVSPTRPGTPQHKGKVENGVHYVQRNFWAGQQFVDLQVANQHLKGWISDTAGLRDHGTTHQAPLRLFAEQERAALLALPPEPFTLCEIKPVKVHIDCHVVIEGSYYSVSHRLIGQRLDAHVGEEVVQLFRGTELVTSHPRATTKGQWITRLEDYPPEKAAYLEKTPQRCREIASRLGPATLQVVETLLAEHPLYQIRAVQNILRLEESVGPQRLEAACARARHFGHLTYREIKGILNAALDREPLPEMPKTSPTRSHQFARPARDFVGNEGAPC